MRRGSTKMAWLTVVVLVFGLSGAAWAAGGADMTGDLLKRVLNFVALAVALVFLLRKPLKKFLSERTANIQAELAELEAKRDAAKAELAKIEATLKAAEADKETILAEYRSQGEKEKAKIIAAAQITAERIKAQAQFTIEQEVALAKAELKREVANMSSQVAEDLIKKNINTADQSRLVDEYLSKVQEVQ